MTDAGWLGVCGIDEVGRGCLAGPVTACAVVFHSDPPDGVRDSKTLSASRRAALDLLIRQRAHISLASSDVAQIDATDILKATLDAMARAHAGLPFPTARVLVDGNVRPPISHPALETVVGGDATCVAIAAASIVAKVARDALMAEIHRDHPEYGWDRNAGYGTPQHMAALAALGHTVHHRMSFAPLRQPALPL